PFDQSLRSMYTLTSTVTAPPLLSPPPLHDALPISVRGHRRLRRDRGGRRAADPRAIARADLAADRAARRRRPRGREPARTRAAGDRKSTRLNSSHGSISYAVFCL